jgi:hypothetical protein
VAPSKPTHSRLGSSSRMVLPIAIIQTTPNISGDRMISWRPLAARDSRGIPPAPRCGRPRTCHGSRHSTGSWYSCSKARAGGVARGRRCAVSPVHSISAGGVRSCSGRFMSLPGEVVCCAFAHLPYLVFWFCGKEALSMPMTSHEPGILATCCELGVQVSRLCISTRRL